MATAISQHVRHHGRHLGFLKILFSANLQPIFLKLVENMFLLCQIIKNRVENRKLEQILSKRYSFLFQLFLHN